MKQAPAGTQHAPSAPQVRAATLEDLTLAREAALECLDGLDLFPLQFLALRSELERVGDDKAKVRRIERRLLGCAASTGEDIQRRRAKLAAAMHNPVRTALLLAAPNREPFNVCGTWVNLAHDGAYWAVTHALTAVTLPMPPVSNSGIEYTSRLREQWQAHALDVRALRAMVYQEFALAARRLESTGGKRVDEYQGPPRAPQAKGWTRKQLVEATRKFRPPGISLTTFDRIRQKASIPAGRVGQKGRIFSPASVERMLAIVPTAFPQCAEYLVAPWQKLLDEPSDP